MLFGRMLVSTQAKLKILIVFMNTLLSYEISWNKPPEAGQEFVVVVSMVRNKV